MVNAEYSGRVTRGDRERLLHHQPLMVQSQSQGFEFEKKIKFLFINPDVGKN